MGNRVRRIKTEISDLQMAQAIAEAWKELFGTIPSKQQISLILAQNALETGNRKSMWNFNIGNITTDGKSQYDFYDDITTKEQIKPGNWKEMNLKYRSYPNLKDGVKDYLKLLSGKKYSKVWQHIITPDPIAFSKSLKDAGYYTANEAPYTRAITKLYKQFNKSNISPIADVANDNSLDSVLNNYLRLVAASEKQNKKIYKKYLPTHTAVINVLSSNYTDSIEFARILCSALEEELLAQAYTHTDGTNVEINCDIQGPSKECLSVINTLTKSVAEAFYSATIKIGGIQIMTDTYMNKKPSCQQITFKSAEQQYRKFLLKFALKDMV